MYEQLTKELLELESKGITKIRMSIAYLFRIKLKVSYLLIKGKRINQLQPIGGVYKYYESFGKYKKLWHIEDEINISIKNIDEQDLRIKVPVSHCIDILNWFSTMKNREVNVNRELEEELLDHPLIREKFGKYSVEFLKRNISEIHYSHHFKCQEILIADVFELHLSKEQERLLEELVKQDSNYKLVSEEEITRGCIQIDKKSYSIGDHSKHIL